MRQLTKMKKILKIKNIKDGGGGNTKDTLENILSLHPKTELNISFETGNKTL